MAVHALKKITVKEVMKGKPKKEDITVAVMNEDGSQAKNAAGEIVTRTVSVAIATDVCVVYGRARDFRSGSTQFGEFIEYIGNFEARRINDGEVFQSTRIIFPPIAADLADEAYTRIKRDDENADVEMAFVIGVEPDARGSDGYKWSCKPIATAASLSDPLAEMRSSLGMNFAATLGAELAAQLGFGGGETAVLIGSSSTASIADQSAALAKENPATDKTAKK